MKNNSIICPSILAADFANLKREVDNVMDAGANMIHFDVMDNHYVPNLTIGPCVAQSLINAGFKGDLDVHLMVKPVDAVAEAFAKLGARYITIHPESTKHIDRTISLIKSFGCLAGVALNPGTPVNVLDCILDKVDLVLVMSVNPGFGGQSFIPSSILKIKAIREKLDTIGSTARLQVDGGINLDNIESVYAAGADTFVAGSAIFGAKDYRHVIAQMKTKLGS
jgi:ribulose-phosphate 3-epimerase